MAKLQDPAVQPEETAAQPGARDKAPAYYKIEEMAERMGVSPVIHAGTCAAMGWQPGKMVTEAEYAVAVEGFRSAPLGGSAKK